MQDRVRLTVALELRPVVAQGASSSPLLVINVRSIAAREVGPTGRAIGVDMVHVAYKGGSAALTDAVDLVVDGGAAGASGSSAGSFAVVAAPRQRVRGVV